MFTACIFKLICEHSIIGCTHSMVERKLLQCNTHNLSVYIQIVHKLLKCGIEIQILEFFLINVATVYSIRLLDCSIYTATMSLLKKTGKEIFTL